MRCPKSLFQSETKCKAIDMTFFLMQIKLIFTRKVLHLVFELGNGLMIAMF